MLVGEDGRVKGQEGTGGWRMEDGGVDRGRGLTVCCFWTASSKSTLPRVTFVMRNWRGVSSEAQCENPEYIRGRRGV